jgi:hypothetical protein
MGVRVIQKMRLCAAVIGGGAVIALAGAAVYFMQGADVTAAGSSSGATAVTTTSTVTALQKAVPYITGPAPLFAGEAPGANPQAPLP